MLLASVVGRRSRRSLGNSDVAFWLISQRILAPVAIVIPIYVLFQNLGMLDTLPALIITYTATNLPIVIWLMRDYFAEHPAGARGGSVRGRRLALPDLPLGGHPVAARARGGLHPGAGVRVERVPLALFLTTSNAQTMPVLVSAQNATRGPEWWYMSVLILIMIMPVIVMAIMLERYIARGSLTGAVKG